MINLIRRLLGTERRKQEVKNAATSTGEHEVAAEQESDDTRELKRDIGKRMHNQRARLNVLEWRADVGGRRTDR